MATVNGENITNIFKAYRNKTLHTTSNRDESWKMHTRAHTLQMKHEQKYMNKQPTQKMLNNSKSIISFI